MLFFFPLCKYFCVKVGCAVSMFIIVSFLECGRANHDVTSCSMFSLLFLAVERPLRRANLQRGLARLEELFSIFIILFLCAR